MDSFWLLFGSLPRSIWKWPIFLRFFFGQLSGSLQNGTTNSKTHTSRGLLLRVVAISEALFLSKSLSMLPVTSPPPRRPYSTQRPSTARLLTFCSQNELPIQSKMTFAPFPKRIKDHYYTCIDSSRRFLLRHMAHQFWPYSFFSVKRLGVTFFPSVQNAAFCHVALIDF